MYIEITTFPDSNAILNKKDSVQKQVMLSAFLLFYKQTTYLLFSSLQANLNYINLLSTDPVQRNYIVCLPPIANNLRYLAIGFTWVIM